MCVHAGQEFFLNFDRISVDRIKNKSLDINQGEWNEAMIYVLETLANLKSAL